MIFHIVEQLKLLFEPGSLHQGVGGQGGKGLSWEVFHEMILFYLEHDHFLRCCLIRAIRDTFYPEDGPLP